MDLEHHVAWPDIIKQIDGKIKKDTVRYRIAAMMARGEIKQEKKWGTYLYPPETIQKVMEFKDKRTKEYSTRKRK